MIRALGAFLRLARKGALLNSENRQSNSLLILIAAAFAAFLATFNETFLNVGFAPIGADLGVGLDTVQWLATGYMLAAAIMVPIAAFAYRSIRTRTLYCATVGLLIIGSVIGFFAPTFPVLLVGRLVQAIGTGMLIPLNMSITLDTAPREKLGTYMGIMGSMTTLGPSLSVILAGVLLSFFSWRALMLTFGILSVACCIVGAVVLRDVADITKPKLDSPSVALVSLGLVLLLYGISTVFAGNIAFALGCIVAGAVFLGLFAKRQTSIETPLVDLRPLRIPAFSIGVLLNMIALIVMFAMNIITPTFMQSVLGASSLMASMTLFPAILLSSVVSPLAGRVYDKHGPRVLLPAGFACITVFSMALALFIGTGNVVLLAALYIPIICGCALVIGPVQSFALSRLSWELNPHGTTVMSVGFQVAGALGSSLFTGVYFLQLNGGLSGGATMAQAGTDAFLAVGVMAAAFGIAAIALSLVEGALSRKPAAEVPAHAPQHSGIPFHMEAVMKRDVFCVSEDTSVLDALRYFLEKGISGAPVANEQGEPVGIITDGDIMRHLARQHTDFKSTYSFMVELSSGDSHALMDSLVAKRAADIATKNVLCVDVHTGLDELCQLMAEHHFNKVPVTDNGKMVGIINRTDVTRYVVSNYLEAVG